jgi:hypothetical protein
MEFIKPQDIIFKIALILLLVRRRPNWLIFAGLVSLLASIPLFQFWIFFTAQKLVLFGFIFILFGVLLNLPRIRDNSRDDNRN